VRVCLDAAKIDAGPQPAILAASILTRAEAEPADFQAAEPLFKDALGRHSADANLLFHVAGVRVVQGKREEAVRLYEQVLTQAPKNSLVLNNLATLLGEMPERRGEALKYIDQALAAAGSQSPLLDTKGMILVYEKRFAEAIKCLEQAAAIRNPDPRYPFHLAVAYLQAGEVEKARRTFALVDSAALGKHILTDTDKYMLEQLKKRFRP
jgi:Flp pilus assembly protein TadD